MRIGCVARRCFSLLVLAFLSSASYVAYAQEGAMKISSKAFEHNQPIPAKYTCQGEDINPPLLIENIPNNAQSLALIVDDPDAPGGMWVHWVVFNIPISNEIAENSVPGTQGSNDFSRLAYGGPCPPSGVHRYFFKVYALDIKLSLNQGASKSELERTMAEHIIQKAELIGTYIKK